jgi:hypothetical protein
VNHLHPERGWRWPESHDLLRERFLAAQPYPHLALDHVFPEEALLAVYREVPSPSSDRWTFWGAGAPENCEPSNSKRGISSQLLLGEGVVRFLQQLNCEAFLADLREITNAPDLTPDYTFNGGGIHCTGRGGRLRVHADKVRHPRPARYDQAINLILFISPSWREEYGGDLQLWSRDAARCVVSIPPLFNRLVLFASDRSTYHGHPEPLLCPEGVFRVSIATYYYRARPNAPDVAFENEIDWI